MITQEELARAKSITSEVTTKAMLILIMIFTGITAVSTGFMAYTLLRIIWALQHLDTSSFGN